MRNSPIAWALYDWANSAFATVVIAGFFPVFFKQYWGSNLEVTESTFHLGLANSIASLLVVFMAPVLGAIADQARGRKRFLAALATLGALSTAGLFLVGQGAWLAASLLFVVGNIGFACANVFYDALLIAVAAPADRDRVSALGYALGYLGGGLLFAFCIAMTLQPAWFGIADAAAAVRLSFLLVACWWVIFSIPIFLSVEEPPGGDLALTEGAVTAGFRQLASTLGHIRGFRNTALFLVAYWLYIDGVDTIVRMAVDYGLAIGLDANDLILALLLTQFVGFPAALVFGRMGQRFGAKTGIQVALAVYVLVTAYAYFMDSSAEFYALAVVIGLVQGGIQALSRSLYSRLIPSGRSAEFFGFYNMLGKFAAVLGPLLVGSAALFSDDPRVGIVSVVVLFIVGWGVLTRVRTDD
jgi:UMF1 family MFS transporter